MLFIHTSIKTLYNSIQFYNLTSYLSKFVFVSFVDSLIQRLNAGLKEEDINSRNNEYRAFNLNDCRHIRNRFALWTLGVVSLH